MTKTEARYRDELELRRLAGEILSHFFEVVTFTLANDLRYTPDFMVVTADLVVEFHEVKPANYKHIANQANSRSKLLVSAEMFPFVFRRAVERLKKDGGGFEVSEVDPR